MAMKTYEVTLPIAGHATLTVEAESQKQAIKKALEEVTIDHVENWEAMERFNQGNFCFCPRPWEAKATAGIGEDDDEAD